MTNYGNPKDEGKKVARSIFAKATVERRARRGEGVFGGTPNTAPGTGALPGTGGANRSGLARFGSVCSV